MQFYILPEIRLFGKTEDNFTYDYFSKKQSLIVLLKS